MFILSLSFLRKWIISTLLLLKFNSIDVSRCTFANSYFHYKFTWWLHLCWFKWQIVWLTLTSNSALAFTLPTRQLPSLLTMLRKIKKTIASYNWIISQQFRRYISSSTPWFPQFITTATLILLRLSTLYFTPFRYTYERKQIKTTTTTEFVRKRRHCKHWWGGTSMRPQSKKLRFTSHPLIPATFPQSMKIFWCRWANTALEDAWLELR